MAFPANSNQMYLFQPHSRAAGTYHSQQIYTGRDIVGCRLFVKLWARTGGSLTVAYSAYNEIEGWYEPLPQYTELYLPAPMAVDTWIMCLHPGNNNSSSSSGMAAAIRLPHVGRVSVANTGTQTYSIVAEFY